jgi:hypothetical protein
MTSRDLGAIFLFLLLLLWRRRANRERQACVCVCVVGNKYRTHLLSAPRGGLGVFSWVRLRKCQLRSTCVLYQAPPPRAKSGKKKKKKKKNRRAWREGFETPKTVVT